MGSLLFPVSLCTSSELTFVLEVVLKSSGVSLDIIVATPD